MLRAHYISISLATVIGECSLTQFSTSLFASLCLHWEPQELFASGLKYVIQGQFSKSQGKFTGHFALHILGLSV